MRRCSCTFCTKHGSIYTSHPDASLAVTLRESAAAGEYTFGTRSARFHLCRTCGTFVFVTSAIDGRDYAVLNVRTLDHFEMPPDVALRDFDGETLDQRLTRRRAGWISNVRISSAGA